MREYIKPRSLTFWAGLISIACGVLLGIHEANPLGWGPDALINMIGTDTSPAMLVTTGLGLIGIRRKLGA
ncbi:MULTISPECIES: hypothetical protein [unclassified Sulfitobacter]|jgi:hypothetical protein|uniref:hypothetical protein n=1 Tax=unclassified Sulfitobacter TaxID=196795 RepID=UPI0007C2B9EE|nr:MULTISPECIES: hypothetical protein [unclassified Sulfitobacter]KZX98054.1 hypothetical protein A3721_06830 [Sulfitobacter sp. HI0023]KZY26823.1 hypothetical protein A3728_14735 [Sulfitobacter sp. HI0040]KZZ67322.1 hypothetical protein A3764_15255 [Sulfitobacter sp. HI0129]